MNNSQGSFANSSIKQKQGVKSKRSFTEFVFNDIAVKGSFLFKEMKLELYLTGNWCFYITTEGINTTTILKNGRKSGPLVNIAFKDNNGNLVNEVALGQVNYDCHDDSASNYICKGKIAQPELIDSVEIKYDAFLDFACRRN